MHNTRAVLFACHYAHRHGDISLIFGDAGAGKTTALKHYTEEHPGVVMVTANSCTSSAASILQMIGSRLEFLQSVFVPYHAPHHDPLPELLQFTTLWPLQELGIDPGIAGEDDPYSCLIVR